MTSPQIEALLREREGYVRRGLDARVAEVDAQLTAAGYTRATTAPPARERAVKRTTEKRAR